MKYACTLLRNPDGCWTASHVGPDVGTVTATADSRQAALEKIRGELRYRLELCPCSGEALRYLEIEVVQRPGRGSR